MSLTDRLAAAARARGEAAPLPMPAPAPPPVVEPEDPRRVLVAASAPAVAVDPDPAADPESVCPTCGRTGEIGVIDLQRRTTDWDCPACATMWRVAMPPVDHVEPAAPAEHADA